MWIGKKQIKNRATKLYKFLHKKNKIQSIIRFVLISWVKARTFEYSTCTIRATLRRDSWLLLDCGKWEFIIKWFN